MGHIYDNLFLFSLIIRYDDQLRSLTCHPINICYGVIFTISVRFDVEIELPPFAVFIKAEDNQIMK